MKILGILGFFLLASVALAQNEGNTRSDIVLDEDVWVLFYDLPSRRFRNARDAFLRRNWPVARRDLAASSGFLRAELARTDTALVVPLEEVIARLDSMAENIETPSVSGSDLDAAFSRAHWLLAQHYLLLSEAARMSRDSRTTADYLWATAHHLERCVMWSNSRLTRRQLASLEKLRDIAGRLGDTDDPASVYKSRPIASAKNTLREIGEHLDRRVWLPGDQGGSSD